MDQKVCRKTNLTAYVSNIVQAMANAWRIVGDNKTKEVIAFNMVLFKRLPFVESMVGDKFYRAVQPAATYRHFTELGISAKERKEKLALTSLELKIDRKTGEKLGKSGERIFSDSFQHRWDGPYTIMNKFSPV